ncbi:MAG: prepilin-type N-terminal cleavage/methylation domain-containing protein [Candidatus Omnitrophica bacterium]|nr:prepilin-type N-terminal cleavage/methylation domain-containing protein [Candidatus Omnitrophota bacterium]MCM8776851.1 prepilin-type N-terminal cleavage/methylation domain-containing protein [Candidatus Omnitrophota bacterium]
MKIHILQEVSEGDKGFSLLEVLIALVIFCIAVFSSITIFKSSLLRFGKQVGEKKVYSEAVKVFNYMERYLVSAMCEEDPRIDFEGESEYIRFISPFSEGPESDLAKFNIYFDREDNKVKVSVIRIDRKENNFNFPAGFPGAQVLGENISSFHLFYYDGKEWKDRWNTAYITEPELPRLIKVEITSFPHKVEGKRYYERFEKLIRIPVE